MCTDRGGPSGSTSATGTPLSVLHGLTPRTKAPHNEFHSSDIVRCHVSNAVMGNYCYCWGKSLRRRQRGPFQANDLSSPAVQQKDSILAPCRTFGFYTYNCSALKGPEGRTRRTEEQRLNMPTSLSNSAKCHISVKRLIDYIELVFDV